MPFHEQNERNSEILTSIKEKGLRPKQKSSIATASGDHNGIFCFNVADLDKVSSSKAMIESLVYETTDGLWSIAMEGVEVKDKGKPALFNSAIQNSVVFIFAVSTELEKACPIKKPILDDKITETRDDDICYFREFRTKSSVDPKNILAILVPIHLESQVAKHFVGVPLIPVEDCRTTLKRYPSMLNASPGASEIEIVLQLLKSEDQKINMELIGADFVDGLTRFITQFPKQRKFGIHLTRLATPAICKTNTLSVVPSKACEEKLINIDYKKFSEEKAERTRLSLSKYSLCPLSKIQLNELETYPHLTILKDHEKRNGYFVICDPIHARLLQRISARHRSGDEAKKAAQKAPDVQSDREEKEFASPSPG